MLLDLLQMMNPEVWMMVSEMNGDELLCEIACQVKDMEKYIRNIDELCVEQLVFEKRDTINEDPVVYVHRVDKN